MVDTTCPNKRVLHYARSNFKNNFDITNIDTQTAPILDYKAPGSFGETGDNRQYSFLMYVNPQRKQIDNLQLPGEGETFDVKKFQTDNGLRDPTAGVGMVVKLGGQADCGGDSPNTVPDNLPSARPPRSSNANARPTSPAAATSASAAQPASSAANNSPGTTPVPSNNTPGNNTGNGPASSGARTSGLVVATSVLQSGGFATSTVALSSAGPDEEVGAGAGASRTPSASPVQQSTNAAPGMGNKGVGMMAPLFAVAGLVLW
ncbi:hypothetical protein FB567DRAFT_519947 [Paraphoma chrysanthemicola]|uniref:Uncharacterized protein n=1 Tax=Paraphoma chrysanthemicola TaxID=798071 RepID=A0A8K0W0K3_9PLEO|nr:hypothetical protein FB567DRAFT_519947 [Paraphoma chrysanthemicola]